MKKIIKIPKWFTKKITDEINNTLKLMGKGKEFQLKGFKYKDIDALNKFINNDVSANQAKHLKKVSMSARDIAFAHLHILHKEFEGIDEIKMDHDSGWFYEIEEEDDEAHPLRSLVTKLEEMFD